MAGIPGHKWRKVNHRLKYVTMGMAVLVFTISCQSLQKRYHYTTKDALYDRLQQINQHANCVQSRLMPIAEFLRPGSHVAAWTAHLELSCHARFQASAAV
jgi:hypothetical protein